jgi:hypothetical protein
MRKSVCFSIVAVFAAMTLSCGNTADSVTQEYSLQAMFIIAALCPFEPCRLSDAELDRIYGN